jgi:hypothetical protein
MSKNSMREQLAKRLKENQERSESFGGGLLFKDEDAKKAIWKCKEGKHIIDILPYEAGRFDPNAKKGDMQYVFEYYFHANLGLDGKQQAMCLNKTYNKPCPICEDIIRMQKDGEDEAIIKALMPKRNPKSIYNILCWDKGEDKKGVQLFIVSHWFMGKHLLELASVPIREGMENELDPIIPFMDPDEGKSVYFRREGEGANDTRFYGHQLLDRPKGFKIKNDVLDQCFCIDEIIKIPTYEEVEEIYNTVAGEKREEPTSRKRKPVDDDEPTPRRRAPVDDDEPAPRRGKPVDDVPDEQCEFGHVFGKDANKFPDDCEDCDQWKECVKATRKAKANDEEPPSRKRPPVEEEEPAPRRRAPVEEEEPEPAPRRRNRQPEPEEEPTPSRRSRQSEPEEEEPEPAPRRRNRR